MQPYQREFIELAIKHEALGFGEFTLKSGRLSPYFFNAGRFCSGAALAQLGECYARALEASKLDYDLLFGPAYKGIPLATATACALAGRFEKDIPYVFNRKEAKDHGEGGQLVGAPMQGRVLIIDDVITAGTAIREVMAIIEDSGAQAAGILIGLNRQERGKGELSAIQEIEQAYGIPVISIIKLEDIVQYMEERGDNAGSLAKITAYRAEFGVK